MKLLAVDPSIRSAGAALFDKGKLVDCRVFKNRDTGSNIARRCLDMAREIYLWPKKVDRFVFEWPQIYRGHKATGDPNDLPGIAGVGSALAGLLLADNGELFVRAYLPKEWAGNLPKATKKADVFKSPRAFRIFSRLDASEAKKVPESHDVLDAIGIGLHSLGRLDVKRLFPRG